jgi:hypothetical protein
MFRLILRVPPTTSTYIVITAYLRGLRQPTPYSVPTSFKIQCQDCSSMSFLFTYFQVVRLQLELIEACIPFSLQQSR